MGGGRWVQALALALALALAGLVGGCGGGDADDDLPVLRLGDAVPGGRFGDASPGPGKVVLDFVEAATADDAHALWELLSGPTRASMGPTYEQFAAGTARRLAEDLADFRRARVLLSRRLAGGWGVGAVSGRYESEDADSEPAAFAAGVRREQEGWRVELGAVVIGRIEPSPLAETGPRPELRAEAATGGDVRRLLMWVDGRPVEAFPSRGVPFTAELRGVPDRDLEPGVHAIVVFASTRDAAGALAWPFEVSD